MIFPKFFANLKLEGAVKKCPVAKEIFIQFVGYAYFAPTIKLEFFRPNLCLSVCLPACLPICELSVIHFLHSPLAFC